MKKPAMIKTIWPSRPSGTVPNRHHVGRDEYTPTTHPKIEISFPGDDRVFAVVTCDDDRQIVREIRCNDQLAPNKFNNLIRFLRSTPDQVLRMRCHRCARNLGAT
jgi:hypothetical protein